MRNFAAHCSLQSRSLTRFSRGAYSFVCRDFNECHASIATLIGAPVRGFSEWRSDRGKTNLRVNWQVKQGAEKFLPVAISGRIAAVFIFQTQ
jgi:hypothetical protein